MLKIEGPIHTLPKVFNRLLFDVSNRILNASVHPIPPNTHKAIPLHTSEVVRFVAIPPAATAATLAACAGIKIAFLGPDQVQPDIPRE